MHAVYLVDEKVRAYANITLRVYFGTRCVAGFWTRPFGLVERERPDVLIQDGRQDGFQTPP